LIDNRPLEVIGFRGFHCAVKPGTATMHVSDVGGPIHNEYIENRRGTNASHADGAGRRSVDAMLCVCVCADELDYGCVCGRPLLV